MEKKRTSNVYTGVTVIPGYEDLEKFYKEGEVLANTIDQKLFPNQCVVLKSGRQSGMGLVKGDKVVRINNKPSLYKIKPKNKEQTFAMGLLSDKDIDLVTITGCPGSGKTLLAMAYAMQMMKNGEVNKIVLCKNFTPVGREIGFLKGDMMAKVQPWLGNFYDNFEVLGVPEYQLDNLTGTNRDPEWQKRGGGKIELSPITFIQGRSIRNAVIIVDEVQNLDVNVVKQILSRPAENSKIILLGDLDQVFEKGVTVEDNGLLAAVEAGKNCEFIASIHMLKSERSRLAQWAWETL